MFLIHHIFIFCLQTHTGSGSDAASLTTKAVYDAATDEYVMNGAKVFISGAGKLPFLEQLTVYSECY